MNTTGNAELDNAWGQAEAKPGTSIDIGRIVVCDACSTDYTESLEPGGLIAGSYAYCPRCVASGKFRFAAREVRARCPTLKSFADFVRDYRGPDGGKITIHAAGNIRGPSPAFTACVSCKQPFTNANVRTSAGWKETQISGMCETCWDVTFAEPDEDEDDSPSEQHQV